MSTGVIAGDAGNPPPHCPAMSLFGLGFWVRATHGPVTILLFRHAGAKGFDDMDQLGVARFARFISESRADIGSGPRSMRSAAAVAALALAGIFMTPTAGTASDSSVALVLSGTVDVSCAIDTGDVGTVIDLGGISAASPAVSGVLDFRISCNAPFGYTLESTNGGLSNSSGAPGSGSDAILTVLPYEVEFEAALEDGDTLRIKQTCKSADILDGATTPCAFANSGTSVAIDQAASLTVSVDESGSVLLGGEYTDSLKLTVGLGL